MRTAAILILASTLASTASASITFDLAGVDEFGDGFNVIGSFESADPGEQVDSISLLDAVLETFDNTGIPNYGDEALLAVQLADADGDSVIYYFFPFPEDDSAGVFGPVSMTLDLSDAGLYIPEDGVVTAMAASIWDDGSGQAAGTWLQGMLAINPVPAPAGLAVLLGAGLARRRRRRHSN